MGDNGQVMERFLVSVERRAFRMAQISTGSTEDALDIVQEAMLGLVRRYRSKPEREWKPLFYSILQGRIRDWYRKHKVRSKWMGWLSLRRHDDNEEQVDPMQEVADPAAGEPMQTVSDRHSIERLEIAIQQLPARQQQAFMLRTWEGLSVADTAIAMACSQGSVKTHYSRAINTLRTELEGQWP